MTPNFVAIDSFANTALLSATPWVSITARIAMILLVIAMGLAFCGLSSGHHFQIEWSRST